MFLTRESRLPERTSRRFVVLESSRKLFCFFNKPPQSNNGVNTVIVATDNSILRGIVE